MTIVRNSATVPDPSVPNGDSEMAAVLKNSTAIDDVISAANADIAAKGDMKKADNLAGLANTSTAQTNLGISAFAKTLLDDADAAAARATMGLVIGTAVEAADSTILKDADIGVTVQGYDADTVIAPGGVLPALDGGNLTGIDVNIPHAPQSIVQANMGTRPTGWSAFGMDVPTESLTFFGGIVTVQTGLQVAYAYQGNVNLSELLSVSGTVDLSAQLDGTYYIYADLDANGLFTGFNFSAIPQNVGFDRIDLGSDLYNPATLVMVNSSDIPIRRVYIGEANVLASNVTDVTSYSLGTQVRLPVNGGTDVVANTEYAETKTYPGPVEAVAEIYSPTISKWVRTFDDHAESSASFFGTRVRTIDNKFIYIKTARNFISVATEDGTTLTTGKCRIVVKRSY
ncbi:protein of unknown function [Pseudodesulfovibrio profundus]|uniref:Uncharacterized protein n=1 Tax=Pseudodesulfovibrio profundus TaxID=57320 RepID=A0A2C8FDR8_9BACT|nr:hypothetical protein [Pseudodesulfovibrio profundus]SOB60648.1 protein of unknown function [Pseudodesulfovibrio profundus]